MRNFKSKKLTSKRLKDLIELFGHILSQRRKEKINVLKYLDDKGIDNISETIYNILYNEDLNKILSKRQKNKLINAIKPNVSTFESIAKRNTPIKRRKHKIIQSGSGIGTILLTLLPVISSLLFKK